LVSKQQPDCFQAGSCQAAEVHLDDASLPAGGNSNLPAECFFVGVEVGPILIRAGVFTSGLRLVGKAKLSTKLERGPEAVFDRVARCVHYAIDECDLRMNQMQGMAVGIAGCVDESQGLVRKSSELGWEDVFVGPGLAEHISVPLQVANSFHLAALGASVHDAKSAPASGVLALFLGPVLGGAFIREGKWSPSDDAALAEIMELPQENVLRTFPSSEFRACRSRDFRRALRQGSRAAQAFLDELVTATEEVISRAVEQLRPQVIVIGGGAIEDVRETILGKIRTKVPAAGPETSLKWIASTLSDSATITGGATWAAMLARQPLVSAAS
jgi:predicted NBD/HSP70 family sugar kinase